LLWRSGGHLSDGFLLAADSLIEENRHLRVLKLGDIVPCKGLDHKAPLILESHCFNAVVLVQPVPDDPLRVGKQFSFDPE
jgi:hypothetical protein